MAEGGREGNMQVGDGGISNTVEVRGFSKKTSQELMEMYFENSRRSGGGDLEEVKISDEVAYITFKEAEVAEKVASRSNHQVDGHTLTVTLFHPLPPKPCYQNRVLIQGVNNAITEELLRNFLETKTKAEVTEFLYGEEDWNVVVTLSDNIDIVQLGKIFQENSIQGVFLKAARVAISNCILVQNLHPSSSHDAILYYFENKRRSGGGDVERVEMKTEERYCLIYFEDPSVIDRVLGRQSHNVDGVDFEIHLHHECLGRRSSRKKSDLYLRMSSPGNKDNVILEDENTDNQAKDKTSSSVSSNPENESDFLEVQEWQENDGNSHDLKLLIKYPKKQGEKNITDVFKHVITCSLNFKLMWNFCTQTDCGRKILDPIVVKLCCQISLLDDDDLKEFFMFKVSDEQFQDESSVKDFVDVVLHKVYNCAQEFLSIQSVKIDPRIKEDILAKLKERKEVDFIWIELVDEGNSVAVYNISQVEHQTLAMQIMKAVIADASESFFSYENMVDVDYMWYTVLTKLGYLVGMDVMFPNTKISQDEEQNDVFLLKGHKDEVEAAVRHLKELQKKAREEVQEQSFNLGDKFELFTYSEMHHYIDTVVTEQYSQCVAWIPNHQTKKMHIFARQQAKNIDKIIKGCVQVKQYQLSEIHPRHIRLIEELKNKYRGKLVIHQSNAGLLVTAADDIFESVDTTMQEILEMIARERDTVSESPDDKDEHVRDKMDPNIADIHQEISGLLSEKDKTPDRGITRNIRVWDENLFRKIVQQHFSEFKENASKRGINMYILEAPDKFGFQLKGSEKEVAQMSSDLEERIKSESMHLHLPKEDNSAGYTENVEDKTNSSPDDVAKPDYPGLEQREWSYPNGKKIMLVKATSCDADVLIIPVNSDKDGQSQFGDKKLVRLKIPDWTEGKTKRDLHEEVEQVLKQILEKTVEICIQPMEGWNFLHYLKCFLYGIYKYFMRNEGKLCPIECVILLVEDTSDYNKAVKIIQESFMLEQDKSEVFAGQELLPQEQGSVFKRIRVKVQKGQLHEAQAEVLVNTVDRILDLTKGVISSSLLEKAGNGIQRELQQYQGNFVFGEVFKTGVGHLPKPCKVIFHGVLYVYEEHSDCVKVFQDFLARCLEDSNKKYRSIAFPPIGTGRLGYPKELVASLLFLSVAKFEKVHPTSRLEEVLFVIYEKDQETLKIFEEMHRRCVDASFGKGTEQQGGSLSSSETPIPTAVTVKPKTPVSVTLSKEDCHICLNKVKSPKTLSCGHTFCIKCVESNPRCPMCGVLHKIIYGNQPKGGEMKVSVLNFNLMGFEKFVTLNIEYKIPSGKQGPNHPEPGKWFGSINKTAYLPDTREGRTICNLLRVAFERRLIFTFGRSWGGHVLTWNDIHHKTSLFGQLGYPDPGYLKRVQEQLAAKGITEADINPETAL